MIVTRNKQTKARQRLQNQFYYVRSNNTTRCLTKLPSFVLVCMFLILMMKGLKCHDDTKENDFVENTELLLQQQQQNEHQELLRTMNEISDDIKMDDQTNNNDDLIHDSTPNKQSINSTTIESQKEEEELSRLVRETTLHEDDDNGTAVDISNTPNVTIANSDDSEIDSVNITEADTDDSITDNLKTSSRLVEVANDDTIVIDTTANNDSLTKDGTTDDTTKEMEEISKNTDENIDVETVSMPSNESNQEQLDEAARTPDQFVVETTPDTYIDEKKNTYNENSTVDQTTDTISSKTNRESLLIDDTEETIVDTISSKHKDYKGKEDAAMPETESVSDKQSFQDEQVAFSESSITSNNTAGTTPDTLDQSIESSDTDDTDATMEENGQQDSVSNATTSNEYSMAVSTEPNSTTASCLEQTYYSSTIWGSSNGSTGRNNSSNINNQNIRMRLVKERIKHNSVLTRLEQDGLNIKAISNKNATELAGMIFNENTFMKEIVLKEINQATSSDSEEAIEKQLIDADATDDEEDLGLLDEIHQWIFNERVDPTDELDIGSFEEGTSIQQVLLTSTIRIVKQRVRSMIRFIHEHGKPIHTNLGIQWNEYQNKGGIKQVQLQIQTFVQKSKTIANDLLVRHRDGELLSSIEIPDTEQIRTIAISVWDSLYRNSSKVLELGKEWIGRLLMEGGAFFQDTENDPVFKIVDDDDDELPMIQKQIQEQLKKARQIP